jgi:hypothetical protein
MVAPILDLLLRSVTGQREDAPSKVSSTWLGSAPGRSKFSSIDLETHEYLVLVRRIELDDGAAIAASAIMRDLRKSLSSQSAYNPLRECGLNIGSAWVESVSLLNGGGTWETVKDQQMKISVVPGLGRKAGISGPANPSINLFILPQTIPPILTNLPQRQ